MPWPPLIYGSRKAAQAAIDCDHGHQWPCYECMGAVGYALAEPEPGVEPVGYAVAIEGRAPVTFYVDDYTGRAECIEIAACYRDRGPGSGSIIALFAAPPSTVPKATVDRLVKALDEMRGYIEQEACICKERDEDPDIADFCGAHVIYDALDRYRAQVKP